MEIFEVDPRRFEDWHSVGVSPVRRFDAALREAVHGWLGVAFRLAERGHVAVCRWCGGGGGGGGGVVGGTGVLRWSDA